MGTVDGRVKFGGYSLWVTFGGYYWWVPPLVIMLDIFETCVT